MKRDVVDVMIPVIEGYGYPPHQAAAVATFFVAAFRGLLIDLVANEKDPRPNDDAMEVFIGTTEVMLIEGPHVTTRALGETPAEAPRRPAAVAADTGDRRRQRAPLTTTI